MATHTRRIDLDVVLDAEAWLRIENAALSVDDAVERLRDLGNEIVRVDREGRRICVLSTQGTHPTVDVWVCDACGAAGRSFALVSAHEKTCRGAD